jgi:hypothetical protein
MLIKMAPQSLAVIPRSAATKDPCCAGEELPGGPRSRRLHVHNDRAARLGLTVVLAIYGLSIAGHPDGGSLLDNVDLPIHETGHLVFSPFGDFMQFAGGTVFQVVMPAIFVVYFLRRKDRHSASVALWWVAQNCWNVSVYAADARAQELPLVGGGEHDWAYMLGELHWLRYDQRVAKVIWTFGVVIFMASIAMGLFAVAFARDAASLELPEQTRTPARPTAPEE